MQPSMTEGERGERGGRERGRREVGEVRGGRVNARGLHLFTEGPKSPQSQAPVIPGHHRCAHLRREHVRKATTKNLTVMLGRHNKPQA